MLDFTLLHVLSGTHKLTCRRKIVLIELAKRKKFKYFGFVLRLVSSFRKLALRASYQNSCFEDNMKKEKERYFSSFMESAKIVLQFTVYN